MDTPLATMLPIFLIFFIIFFVQKDEGDSQKNQPTQDAPELLDDQKDSL